MAVANDGGGVYAYDGATVVLDGVSVYNNSAGNNGGGIAAFEAVTLDLLNVLVQVSTWLRVTPNLFSFACVSW